jgi:hypothetical protein
VDDLGDRPQIGRSLLSLGQLEYARNASASAVDYLKQAKHLYRSLGDPRGIVATCFMLSRIYIRKPNWLLAANELVDGFMAGFSGGLTSYQIIIGAIRRWGKW